MTVKIAVVQQEIRPGQVESNRNRALAAAEQAVRNAADIVLLPEGVLIGYAPNVHDLAEPVDGPTTQAFRRLLKGSDAMVLYGLTEREGENCYLAATLVAARGVVANYRKTHLWWASEPPRCEAATFQPGHKLVTFDLAGFRSGVMICYDGDFPEMTRSYANLGCAVVFWMNNRPSRGPEEVRPLAGANSMFIASACCCGKDEAGRDCRGGSNITGPYANTLAEIWDAEGVIYADVNPQEALDHRPRNPWYTGRRPELYV